jgi:hypothetical protein
MGTADEMAQLRSLIEQALMRIRLCRLTRDGWIREAHLAGFSKMEIHTLTGLARTTIDAILSPHKPR